MDSSRFARMLGWKFGGFSITLPGSFFWAWGFEGIIPGMMAIGIFLAAAAHFGQRAGCAGLISRSLMILLVIMLLDVGFEFQSIIVFLTRSLAFLVAMSILVHALPLRTQPLRRQRGLTWSVDQRRPT